MKKNYVQNSTRKMSSLNPAWEKKPETQKTTEQEGTQASSFDLLQHGVSASRNTPERETTTDSQSNPTTTTGQDTGTSEKKRKSDTPLWKKTVRKQYKNHNSSQTEQPLETTKKAKLDLEDATSSFYRRKMALGERKELPKKANPHMLEVERFTEDHLPTIKLLLDRIPSWENYNPELHATLHTVYRYHQDSEDRPSLPEASKAWQTFQELIVKDNNPDQLSALNNLKEEMLPSKEVALEHLSRKRTIINVELPSTMVTLDTINQLGKDEIVAISQKMLSSGLDEIEQEEDQQKKDDLTKELNEFSRRLNFLADFHFSPVKKKDSDIKATISNWNKTLDDMRRSPLQSVINTVWKIEHDQDESSEDDDNDDY